MKLSIVIPVYNGANTIHLILNKVKAVVLPNNIEKELIIVNDKSTDETAASINKYRESNSDLNIQFYEKVRNPCSTRDCMNQVLEHLPNPD